MSDPTNPPIILTVNGRTISAVPCSEEHRDYFEAGFLVASCRKCKLMNITPKGEPMKCQQCNGEGYTGSDDEHAPWSFWESLPPGSDFAVRMGFVVKVTCGACGGSGDAL